MGQLPRHHDMGMNRSEKLVAEVRAGAMKAEAVTERAAAVMATAAVATAVVAMDDQYKELSTTQRAEHKCQHRHALALALGSTF